MEKPKPRIGIIIGAEKYLRLCLPGLKYLAEEQTKGNISVPWGIEIADKYGVLRTLMSLHIADVWIIGSAGTNELFIVAYNFLRDILCNRVPVIGVSFDGRNDLDFLKACQRAVSGDFSLINLKPAPPPNRINLDEAIEAAEKMLVKKL